MSQNVHDAKISKKHSTIIDAAIPLIEPVVRREEVRRVTPGFIASGIKKKRDHRTRVKIGMEDGCVTIQVRGNISSQEIRIYTSNAQKTAEAIARLALDTECQIKFHKQENQELATKPELPRKMK